MQSRNKLFVKVYHGYGHAQNLIVFGHVLKNYISPKNIYANGVLLNIRRLLRLFFIKTVPHAKLRLRWADKEKFTVAEADGFFKFEWEAEAGIKAGWHTVSIDCINNDKEILATGEGKVFVPHVTQYAFISDIDDTILMSYSATILKRLRLLFFKNPHTRTAFSGAADRYRLLATAQTTASVPNPFYYVSSSEWNLYDDLNEFFRYNNLPQGVFLLNEIKKWNELFKTGKTKHEGKLLRMIRIIDAFPKQQFVLMGDNSQRDPSIYASIVEKFPKNIFAVYIRNVYPKNKIVAATILKDIETKGVHTCLFLTDAEAVAHSEKIGLITKPK